MRATLIGSTFLSLLASISALSSSLHLQQRQVANSTCRVIPIDPQWPSEAVWSELNTTIKGQLIKTVPIGHVCHNSTFNAAKCDEVKAKWNDLDWRTSIPESILSPSFANNSCDPNAARETPCEVGGYAHYSINVSSPLDVSVGLKFARDHNIRLVVKNTGHE